MTDPTEQEPARTETPQVADLAVGALPPDAPDAPRAAAGDSDGPGREALADDPAAARDSRVMLQAYADALAAGDVGGLAELFAEKAVVQLADGQVNGRDAIGAWHGKLLELGPVTARPTAQGDDQGRLTARSRGGEWKVEVAFDASGRIGTVRWVHPDVAAAPQESRQDGTL